MLLATDTLTNTRQMAVSPIVPLHQLGHDQFAEGVTVEINTGDNYNISNNLNNNNTGYTPITGGLSTNVVVIEETSGSSVSAGSTWNYSYEGAFDNYLRSTNWMTNAHSWFSSGSIPQYVTIRIAEARVIGQIKIWKSSGTTIKKWTLFGANSNSLSGASWTQIGSQQIINASSDWPGWPSNEIQTILMIILHLIILILRKHFHLIIQLHIIVIKYK